MWLTLFFLGGTVDNGSDVSAPISTTATVVVHVNDIQRTGNPLILTAFGKSIWVKMMTLAPNRDDLSHRIKISCGFVMFASICKKSTSHDLCLFENAAASHSHEIAALEFERAFCDST